MNNQFVADGYRRFLDGQRVLSGESVEKKHAKQLADASPAEKSLNQQKMARELERKKSHQPSAGTLW